MTRFSALALSLTVAGLAAAQHPDTFSYPVLGGKPVVLPGTCETFFVQTEITAERGVMNISISDNWDVNTLTINNSRRDHLAAFNAVESVIPAVTQTFNVSATFCLPSKKIGDKANTVLLLTHGVGADSRYWNPPSDFEQYNFLKYILDKGYTVFYYDRLGTGQTEKPDPIHVVHFPTHVGILKKLTTMLRAESTEVIPKKLLPKGGVKKIVHVGHSYGAYMVAAIGATSPPGFSDGLIFSGWSGYFTYFTLLFAGWQPRNANTVSPEIWGHLPTGYLTPIDQYADAYLFKDPYYEHAVSAWKSLPENKAPYAAAELETFQLVSMDASAYTGPVQVVQGRYDLSACGGNCDGILDQTATLFNSSKVMEIYVTEAGHDLYFHYNATGCFEAITSFLDRNIQ